jgi:hypothetical protein
VLGTIRRGFSHFGALDRQTLRKIIKHLPATNYTSIKAVNWCFFAIYKRFAGAVCAVLARHSTLAVPTAGIRTAPALKIKSYACIFKILKAVIVYN